MNDIPRSDAQIVRELARDAKSLKDDRAFMAAIALLKRQWQNEFLICADANLATMRAKLQVLEVLPQMLDSLIADDKMAQQRGQHGGR